MKKIIYLLSFIVLGIFASCERDSANIEFLNTINIDGKWEVTAHNDTMAISAPFTVQTTSSKNSTLNDSLIIKDSKDEFWSFQVTAALNEEFGTFETELSPNEVCEERIGVKIFNGKIINNDSIYFEIQFEDDVKPYESTYILKGHRK